MTDHRKLMDPSTFETLIILQADKELWDEWDMEQILSKPHQFDEDDDEATVLGSARAREDRETTSHSTISPHSFSREVRQRTPALLRAASSTVLPSVPRQIEDRYIYLNIFEYIYLFIQLE